MKTLKKISLLLCMAIVTCCCFLFTGCSFESLIGSISNHDGTYKLQKISMEMDGTTITVNVGEMFYGTRLDEDYFGVILSGDTVTIRTKTTYDGDTNTSLITGVAKKWDDNEYLFEFDSSSGIAYPLIATFNGNTMELKMTDGEDMTIFLKK